MLNQQVLTYRGCLYNEAHFSKGLGYFLVDCKGPDVPKVILYNGVTLQQESRRRRRHSQMRRITVSKSLLIKR